MKALSTSLLLLISMISAATQTPDRPVFEVPSENLTESGYIKLSWDWNASTSGETAYAFELQQAGEPLFSAPKTIYQGQDFATFLSGLRNGEYYYRIRATVGSVHSEWSEPVLVQVQHHSLTFAFTLFGLGALVFLLTVGIVVQGNRRMAQMHS